MKGKRKNTNRKEPDDFLRYRRNDMPESERNAFEKNLQKDPFSEEAAEGFSIFEPDKISADLASLDKRLKRRTQRSKRMTWYRIAASVAVLMIISSVYIVIDKNRSVSLSEKAIQPDTINIAGAAAIKRELPVAKAIDRRVSGEQGKPSGKPADKEEAPAEPSREEKKYADVSENQITENQKLKKEAEEAAAPKADEKSDSFILAEEQGPLKVYSSKLPASRSAVAGRSVTTDYTPAEPVSGKDSFDIYIRKNIRMPRQLPSDQDSVVILSFILTGAGVPTNIKIIRTPGEDYSKEAIRLLKEGPKWKPASRNGEYIRDKVTIEIPFR